VIAAGMLAGAGLGLGLLLLGRGLLSGPRPLATALAELHAPAMPEASWAERSRNLLATRARDLLHLLGGDLRRLDKDLRVVDRSLERHLLEKLAAASVGLGLPPAMALVAASAGVTPPVALTAVSAIGLAVVGFLVPDMLVRGQAAERRRAFKFALSSYLDLVHVVLAAGAGVETALSDAAEAGHGWPFAQLRSALVRSRIAGESPWEAFRRLGEDLDVAELREVASSLGLAGTQGAKVRASLEARAMAMRARDLSEMEAAAESATERMSVPSVLLVVGFILFVGYPAAWEILGF
jgi:tight adherence protein C